MSFSLKKLIALIFIFNIITFNSNAQEQPSISFNRILPSVPLAPAIGSSNDESYDSAYYYRLINEPSEEVKFKYDTFQINEQNFGAYNLLSFYCYEIPSSSIYIFENNKVIGYLILDKLFIGYNSDDPIVQQIKSLSINSSYLQGQINLPANTTLTFYERETTNYVERYGIIKAINTNHELIILDSFYPKSLENEIKNTAIDYFNNKLLDAIQHYL